MLGSKENYSFQLFRLSGDMFIRHFSAFSQPFRQKTKRKRVLSTCRLLVNLLKNSILTMTIFYSSYQFKSREKMKDVSFSVMNRKVLLFRSWPIWKFRVIELKVWVFVAFDSYLSSQDSRVGLFVLLPKTSPLLQKRKLLINFLGCFCPFSSVWKLISNILVRSCKNKDFKNNISLKWFHLLWTSKAYLKHSLTH